MKIGVLGTGMVGAAIASKLVSCGHEVMMGARESGNPKALAWTEGTGHRAHAGSFAETAAFGEVVFNCTKGVHSLEAIGAAAEQLGTKILIDVANVLPPSESGQSLGEQIQAAFPRVRVVKTLNTINCAIMVEPERLPVPHTVFLSGNDSAAKATVRELLRSFGWRDVVDLGDITTARATETYLPLWLAMWKSLGTAAFNIQVVR